MCMKKMVVRADRTRIATTPVRRLIRLVRFTELPP
jgi:hypothetical protein